MKCWRPFVFLSAAICGIVFFALAIQDVFAGTPGDQRTARRSFLQSTLGVRGNYELYVPQDQAITHYWRYNDVPWFPWFAATDKLVYPCATGSTCPRPRSITLIQSSFTGNFEAIVRVAPAQPTDPDYLDVWSLDASWQWKGPFPLVADGQPVTGVTGDPVLIQSTWGIKGNFEVFVPQGNVIGHYFRDNDSPGFPWHIAGDRFGYACPPKPCYTPRGLSLIQSSYKGDGTHGNFEAVVRVKGLLAEPEHLDMWYLDSGTWIWHGPFPLVADGQLVSNVTGDPVLIQSKVPLLGAARFADNFEVYVPQGDMIHHYYRDNNDPLLPWYVGIDSFGYPCPSTARCPTPRGLTLIQSNFLGNGVAGNFEAVVRVSPSLAIEPDHLDFWYFDTNTMTWSGPMPIVVGGQTVYTSSGLD